MGNGNPCWPAMKSHCPSMCRPIRMHTPGARGACRRARQASSSVMQYGHQRPRMTERPKRKQIAEADKNLPSALEREIPARCAPTGRIFLRPRWRITPLRRARRPPAALPAPDFACCGPGGRLRRAGPGAGWCLRLPPELLFRAEAEAAQAAAHRVATRPPLPICLKTLLICAYWRSSWFTSCTPGPGAAANTLSAPRRR